MRYVKALIILMLFFVGTVFFIQNEAIITKEIELTLRLYFVPEMKSLKLPFYYLMLGSFFVGGLLIFAMLWWGNAKRMARELAYKSKIAVLQAEACSLRKKIGIDSGRSWWIFGKKRNSNAIAAGSGQNDAVKNA